MVTRRLQQWVLLYWNIFLCRNLPPSKSWPPSVSATSTTSAAWWTPNLFSELTAASATDSSLSLWVFFFSFPSICWNTDLTSVSAVLLSRRNAQKRWSSTRWLSCSPCSPGRTSSSRNASTSCWTTTTARSEPSGWRTAASRRSCGWRATTTRRWTRNF